VTAAAPRPRARAPAGRVPGGHVPVLLHEMLDVLQPRDGGIYIDGTFGGGGYSRGLLSAADCTVWALDRDSEAVARGAELSAEYPGRLTVLEARFGDMDAVLGARGVAAVDGIALDVGVSSPQIDDPARGFSFAADGPLDMRMDPQAGGSTAADAVNRLSEAALADIIFQYGEDRAARRIARAIVRRRDETPFARTLDLAETVRKASGPRRGVRIDPATRTFQALRIHVNDELGELGRGLAAAERLLAPRGRLAVVCFHSLEDRLAKRFLVSRAGGGGGASRHRPEPATRAPSFHLLARKAIRSGDAEIAANPRSRSARLRGAERTDADPWPLDAPAGPGGTA